MGFLSWYSNVGSIGSTVRWAIKGYSAIRSKNKKISDNQIFIEMIKIRYTTLPDKEKKDYLLKQAKKMPGLYGLVVDILCVEAGLHKNDGYYIDEIVKPIFLALEKTNFSHKTKYGKFKFGLGSSPNPSTEELSEGASKIEDKLWNPGGKFLDYVLDYSRRVNFKD